MNQSSFFLKMIVSVLILRFHLSVVAGEQGPDVKEYRLICLNQTIVKEDDVARIQCVLDPPLNLTAADVKKDSKLIIWIRNGISEDTHVDGYTNWSLDIKDLSKGKVTLSIFSVRLSDGGKIEIYIPSLYVLNYTDLIVVKKVQEQHGGTNDSSSTAPPESHDVNQDKHGGRNDSNTTSNDHDGENWKHVIPIVIVSIFLLRVLVFLTWPNIGKIRECINMIRGRMEQGAELGRPAADEVV